MKNRHRDEVIDLFKGFTILWVVHIHTVFWSGSHYIPDYVRELSLFIDVPIFFFLSGYLLFTGPFKTIFKRSLNQFKRLYLTYLFFTLIIFFVSFFLRFLFGRPTPPFASMLLDIVTINVIFPELKGFSWNLWFLQTYLFLVLVIPLFSLFGDSLKRNFLLLLLFFIAFTTLSMFSYSKLPFYVVFYGIIFFMGSIYRRVEKQLSLKTYFFSLLLVLIGAIVSFCVDDFTFVLQNNKFPPSLTYLFYSLIFIFGFIFVKSFYGQIVNKLHPVIKKMLLWSSREVFDLYLMQSVVCSLPFLFVPMVKDIIPTFPLYFMILSFNLTLSIALVWLLKRLLQNRLTGKITLGHEGFRSRPDC